jgi:NitT/TauT family transport system ATP-binding protein
MRELNSTSRQATALPPYAAHPRAADAVIRVEHVTKVFRGRNHDTVTALEGVSLSVPYGEFVTVVGPSGCGKSTLLKMIAGLVPVSSGRIWYQDREVRELNTHVGYVPKESKLFPWLTLEENVAFGLEFRSFSRAEKARRVHYLIGLAGLTGFEQHYPAQLSGGMSKRASIIRALAYDPAVILMDEPFGPLDAQTRMILQDELLNIWERQRQTIVFVTHDLIEAVALADRVVVMGHRPGRIKEVITIPMSRPRNIFAIHRQAGFAEAHERLWNIFRHELNFITHRAGGESA